MMMTASFIVLSLFSGAHGFQTIAQPRQEIRLRASSSSEGAQRVREYFEAWNARDMQKAVSCFAEDCSYDDTQYADAFVGRESLSKHLYRVAKCLPESFRFVLDDVADGGDRIGVRWHVESEGKPLPFTRGSSFYVIEDGLIASGFDVPEPAPLKPGDSGLRLLSFASDLIKQPQRLLPLICWGLYVQQVFFGHNLPGPDATSLDPATWIEVKDLSLNFWLVGPFLFPDNFPVVHPVLEGLFNIVLAWSALFAGFLADQREPRDTGFFKVLVGMQLLTNAFFLPYLATRPSEEDLTETQQQLKLSAIEQVGESPVLPLLLCAVFFASVSWALFGRPELFGADRFDTFKELASTDRLTSSFIVDITSYSLFQAWLVPDDLKRRNVVTNDEKTKYLALSAIPFIGLVVYFLVRRKLPTLEEEGNSLL